MNPHVSAHVGLSATAGCEWRCTRLAQSHSGGEIYPLEKEQPWQEEFVTEEASFTGAGDEIDDQVDDLAYAVLAAGSFARRSWSMSEMALPGKRQHPR